MSGSSLRPVRRPDWMLGQLPVGMLQEDFFVRFVSIFQEMGGTLLADADTVEHLADVTVTPRPFLPYLGSWTGAPALDASLPEAVQRDVVRSWSRLLAWRGTRRGLEEFLALVLRTEGGPDVSAAAGDVSVVESGGVTADGSGLREVAPASVYVRVPSTGWLAEADFAALVRDEVPADVHLELWVGERRLLPPPEAAAAPLTSASLPVAVDLSDPARPDHADPAAPGGAP